MGEWQREVDPLVSRQLLEHQFGLDKEHVEKRYSSLRPAFGLDALAKWADDMQEAVPGAAVALDFVFGKKPEDESHDPVWWQHERPRPWRGATADPSVPAKVRAEHEAALKRAAKEGKDAAMIAAKAAEDKAAEEQAERQAIFEHAAEAETQLRRLSFFGRPVQKFRVIMRERQTERQEREHQAAMFAHLREDAQTEYKLQVAKHKAATAAMKKAAAAASALRAEERGAAQAAAGLAIHASLADARETALAAAASFREQAQAEEATARKQRAAMEKAWEIMQREDEKMAFCKASIRENRQAARQLIQELCGLETKLIIALIMEGNLLEQFQAVWKGKLQKVPAGSPAASAVQAQIDGYAQKIDVVKMERRMFAPKFNRLPAPPAGVSAEDFTFKYRKVQQGLDLVNDLVPRDWAWVETQVAPGQITTGAGSVGPPLMMRKKVVLQAGADEFPDITLPEEALADLDVINLRADFFASGDESKFLSRAQKDKGEREPGTPLAPHEFSRMWGQDRRHSVATSIAVCSAKLRHRPAAKFLASWLDRAAMDEGALLDNSPNLGPPKLPYKPVLCPPLHPSDKLNAILAFDQNPRCIGRIVRWLVEPGARVEDQQALVEIDVFDPRLVSKKNRTGSFVPEDHGFGLQEQWAPGSNRVTLLNRAAGTIMGMMRPPDSKVTSFENLALVDVGEPGWARALLPLEEWDR